jgi:hypothetical protein
VTYQNVLNGRVREQTSSEAKDGPQKISEKDSEEDGGNQTSSNDVEARRTVISASAIKEVKLSISDVNPFPAYISILSRKNNILILLPSGEFPE